ncbi:hypothetical protein ACFSHQ_04300 [Gemmobacter lanyuensis]
MRPGRPAAPHGAGGLGSGAAGGVLACALPPSIILTLPTGHYLAGAGPRSP